MMTSQQIQYEMGAIVKIVLRQHLNSQHHIVRLTRNLFSNEEAESHDETCHVTRIANFENSTWRTAAILKLFFFSVSRRLIIRF